MAPPPALTPTGAVGVEGGEYGDVAGRIEVERVVAGEGGGHAVPDVDGVEGELGHVVGDVVTLIVGVGGGEKFARAAGAVAGQPRGGGAIGVEGDGPGVDVDFPLGHESRGGVRPVAASGVLTEDAVVIGVALDEAGY